MNKAAFNAWLSDYREALVQAAGIAYILGLTDHAKTLHELSCQAMGIDATANKRQNDIDTATKTRYNVSKKQEGKTMKTYTRHEYNGYDIYVSDDTNRVHHAVKIDTENPSTLYPYEPCKTGGLDNCCGFYTLQQVKNRMKTGKIVFR